MGFDTTVELCGLVVQCKWKLDQLYIYILHVPISRLDMPKTQVQLRADVANDGKLSWKAIGNNA